MNAFHKGIEQVGIVNRYGLTEREVETVIGMAENDLDASATARAIYISLPGVAYRIKRIVDHTGLDPRNFFDLVALVRSVAPERLGSEEELNDAAKIIMSRLPRAELLTQLAEEAAELAQAALKLRRTLSAANPTPVTQERALESLLEELADVQNSALLVRSGFRIQQAKVDVVAGGKMQRWADRLIEA